MRRATLQQAVGEAARGGANVDCSPAPATSTPNASSAFLELLAATGDVRRQLLDAQLDDLVDLLSGLVVARDEPGEDERLRLGAALGQAALHEQRVEPLLHDARGSWQSSSTALTRAAMRDRLGGIDLAV